MSEIYTDPPQSRNEAIIKATIDGTEYTAPPQSRMEDLLLELKEAIEQGGGGGTSDYSQLSNKPSINDVTLSGNKTASDLGLMPAYEVDTTPTESSENLITSGGVWTADKNINNKLQGSKTAGSTDGSPFEIPDYGMTESIDMYFKPTQDLHGYDKPWAGGAGKNKLPLTVDGLKSSNTDGTWSGNTYTLNGVTFEVLTDSADNVLGVKVNGTASASTNFGLTDKLGDMSGLKYNGAGAGTTNNKCLIVGYWDARGEWIGDGRAYGGNDYTILDYPQMSFGIYVQNTQTLTDETFYPMIRLSTETDPTFEPYSNICPISGQNNATFEWTDDEDIETEVTMNFGNTYYGGFCQFASGAIYSTFGVVDLGDLTWTKGPTSVTGKYRFYASISNNKESSISAPTSLSSHYSLVESYATYTNLQDGYVLGSDGKIYMYLEDYNDYSESDFASAMSGVQIAYELATPSYFRVTPPANLNLTDDYPIEYNGYMASIGYQPKNTVLAEAKKYTNQEIAKLGLPQPPTTDGTYHLECSVSGGNPTITWVLNS